MNILVSRGTGVMGSRLVHGLTEAGHTVRVLTLPNDPLVNRLHGSSPDIYIGLLFVQRLYTRKVGVRNS